MTLHLSPILFLSHWEGLSVAPLQCEHTVPQRLGLKATFFLKQVFLEMGGASNVFSTLNVIEA